MVVKLQSQHDPEARAQRRRKQPSPRRRADKRKRLDIHCVSARRRALPDHDVQLVIFECRIKNFFQSGLQPVYLVNKEHLLVTHIGENRR